MKRRPDLGKRGYAGYTETIMYYRWHCYGRKKYERLKTAGYNRDGRTRSAAFCAGDCKGAGLSNPERTLHLWLPGRRGADVIVRFFAEQMRPLLGKNRAGGEPRAGALGNIATEYTARSKPDGYTIYLAAPSTLAANQHLLRNPSVDIVNELQITATINRQPLMVAVKAHSVRRTRQLPSTTTAMKAKGRKGKLCLCESIGQGGRGALQSKSGASGGGRRLPHRCRLS